MNTMGHKTQHFIIYYSKFVHLNQFQSFLRLFSEIFSLFPLFLVDLLLCYFIFNIQIIVVSPTPIRICCNFLLHLELQKATVPQSNTILSHPFLRAWSPIAYHTFFVKKYFDGEKIILIWDEKIITFFGY